MHRLALGGRDAGCRHGRSAARRRGQRSEPRTRARDRGRARPRGLTVVMAVASRPTARRQHATSSAKACRQWRRRSTSPTPHQHRHLRAQGRGTIRRCRRAGEQRRHLPGRGPRRPRPYRPSSSARRWRRPLGPVALCQAFVPGMRARRWGRVVNVSSSLGQLESMTDVAPSYAVSKAALNALTRLVAAAAGEHVLVNSADPGWVRTRMGGQRAGHARSRRGWTRSSGWRRCPTAVRPAVSLPRPPPIGWWGTRARGRRPHSAGVAAARSTRHPSMGRTSTAHPRCPLVCRRGSSTPPRRPPACRAPR